jgi:uncharacterized protein RhaS with RHS repeats
VVAQEAPLRASGADWDGSTQWHFEPDGFRPLARQEAPRAGAAGRTLYVVNDHLGTPRELIEESGEQVWSSELTLWGAARSTWRAPVTGRRSASAGAFGLPDPGEGLEEPALCPLRFQGQWEDEESGLYYDQDSQPEDDGRRERAG